MRISLTMMVIVLSTEALSFSGCGEREQPSMEYRYTPYVSEDEGMAAWVEFDGKRYRVRRVGDFVYYEEI